MHTLAVHLLFPVDGGGRLEHGRRVSVMLRSSLPAVDDIVLTGTMADDACLERLEAILRDHARVPSLEALSCSRGPVTDGDCSRDDWVEVMTYNGQIVYVMPPETPLRAVTACLNVADPSCSPRQLAVRRWRTDPATTSAAEDQFVSLCYLKTASQTLARDVAASKLLSTERGLAASWHLLLRNAMLEHRWREIERWVAERSVVTVLGDSSSV
jgi:hypothetical protein